MTQHCDIKIYINRCDFACKSSRQKAGKINVGDCSVSFLFQYLNYAMKVMVSEILIKIYMDIHHTSHDESEEAMMD